MTFQSRSDFFFFPKKDVDEGRIAGDGYMHVYVCAFIAVCLLGKQGILRFYFFFFAL